MPASNDAIARRLAGQMWRNPVDHQKKLADGIWMFSTPGHGGIVVDTNIRPELASYNTEVRYHKNHAYYSEQHFAAFEEDCMAAIVEWLYASEIHTKAFRNMFVADDAVSDEEWFRKRIEMLRASLEMWNPDVLQKYPDPSMCVKKGENK